MSSRGLVWRKIIGIGGLRNMFGGHVTGARCQVSGVRTCTLDAQWRTGNGFLVYPSPDTCSPLCVCATRREALTAVACPLNPEGYRRKRQDEQCEREPCNETARGRERAIRVQHRR